MIEINNLEKSYGSKKAIDIAQYSIADGDMLGLVGNNGAGKTTLFRLILDLVKADTGTVAIAGTDVTRTEDWKDITGAYIDDGFLIDYLTPEEYFYFIGRMYGLKKEEVDERLQPFDRFMNGEVLGQKKFIRNYSMGNKQKIGIISAMLHHPQLHRPHLQPQPEPHGGHLPAHRPAGARRHPARHRQSRRTGGTGTGGLLQPAGGRRVI